MNTDPNQIQSKNLFWQYDSRQKELYRGGDPACQYWKERWLAFPEDPKRRGNVERADRDGKAKSDYWSLFGGRIGSSGGEFPAVFVRHNLREMGYTVWGSEPRLVNPTTRDPEGYVLLSFPGKRKDSCYGRMTCLFGEKRVKGLIAEANKRKLALFRTQRGGGDPDLFAFNSDKKFFVEVKDEHDKLSAKQILCFWLIEQHLECEVKVCHVAPAETVPGCRLSLIRSAKALDKSVMSYTEGTLEQFELSREH